MKRPKKTPTIDIDREARDNVVRDELEAIARAHRGMLRQQDVVDYARDPGTALHGRFEWDDGEAAERYRLQQAGAIIRNCYVRLLSNGESQTPVRAFVSLTTERDGQGYRSMITVLNESELREQMLQDALGELAVFRRKYARLKELAGVCAEIDLVLQNGENSRNAA